MTYLSMLSARSSTSALSAYFSMPCALSTDISISSATSADFCISGAVCCHPTRPAPASSSATSKHRQNSRVPKNQIYFPVVSLKFANSVAGPPPPQKEGQLGAGSQRGAVRRTFLKMSKLAEASQNVGVDMPWGMKA